MNLHRVKTETKYFRARKAGDKPWEVRLNDRDYQVGDILEQVEIEDNGAETGRVDYSKIAYMMNDERFLKDGYVVMTLRHAMREDVEPILKKHGRQMAEDW